MTETLERSNSLTYWVPDFVKEKRFGNWLREARDWAVSRNRYWGTPIPIWKSSTGEIHCVGSIAELEKLTGTTVTDIHRESIDHLEIPSVIDGNPPLQRVPEVFDCWFESGSMPYAQIHYPFENAKKFKDVFPADFIAEGIDQTRGWFYTLLVVSTALFGKAPFKNLIANGLILAEDGQKMSKRKGNYPDPMEIVGKYGADAVRLYLINSPVVRAENLRFKEDGVRDVIKDVFLPWYNAFRFLMQSIEGYVQDGDTYQYSESNVGSSGNIMDKWMLSFTQSLLEYVRKEMELYHLYNVIPRLTKYVDYLTNWYVRMNRKRLKGENGKSDCKFSIDTLFNVIFNIVKIMSPFVPFLTETMYQYLRDLVDEKQDSVHYLMFPKPVSSLIDVEIERAVARMQSVIDLGRIIRERKTMPVKYPLPEVVVVHQNPQYVEDVKSLENYVLSELNVRKLTITTDKSKYGVTLRAEPDHKTLGLRLKQHFKAVAQGIKALTDSDIKDMMEAQCRDVCGHRIELSEIRLIFKTDDLSSTKYEIHSDNDVLVLLDCTPDISMQDEGLAREIINRIQKLRKKVHLVVMDEVTAFYQADDDLNRIIENFKGLIEETTKTPLRVASDKNPSHRTIIEEQQQIKGSNIHFVLAKVELAGDLPLLRWLNVEVLDVPIHSDGNSNRGLVLIENGGKVLDVTELKREISTIFGILVDFHLLKSDGAQVDDLETISGQTVYVSSVITNNLPECRESNIPFCKTVNFERRGINGTLILENPQGVPTNVQSREDEIVNLWLRS